MVESAHAPRDAPSSHEVRGLGYQQVILQDRHGTCEDPFEDYHRKEESYR